MSAKRKLTIRLPSEWEWQWAAFGSTGQRYPWGNDWYPARANDCNAGIGRTVAVGLYPLSRSPSGIDDLVGNVRQWCLDPGQQPSDIPLIDNYLNITVHDDILADHAFDWTEYEPLRIVRGVSWYEDAYNPAWERSSSTPSDRHDNIGFRVLCLSPIDETLPSAIDR